MSHSRGRKCRQWCEPASFLLSVPRLGKREVRAPGWGVFVALEELDIAAPAANAALGLVVIVICGIQAPDVCRPFPPQTPLLLCGHAGEGDPKWPAAGRFVQSRRQGQEALTHTEPRAAPSSPAPAPQCRAWARWGGTAGLRAVISKSASAHNQAALGSISGQPSPQQLLRKLRSDHRSWLGGSLRGCNPAEPC